MNKHVQKMKKSLANYANNYERDLSMAACLYYFKMTKWT